jgi:hypothetical protein
MMVDVLGDLSLYDKAFRARALDGQYTHIHGILVLIQHSQGVYREMGVPQVCIKY